MAEVVNVINLCKSFRGNKVLRGLSFKVEEGEVISIIGKSGAGKTVLLKTIVGLERPDRGRIFLFGSEVTKLGRKALLKLRENIGFVFQSSALFDFMTVYENVAYPFTVKEIDHEIVREKVRYYLEKVAMKEYADTFPSELSGGMKKRVAIARALATEPGLILYDEPTAGLDVATGETIVSLMEKLNQEKKITSIVVTHDINLARRISDRILYLSDGVIVREFKREDFNETSFEEIFKKLENREVQL
ncbi:MAG: ABC transporter ATP-binding protein [Candidatus Hydrothermia bacterium]